MVEKIDEGIATATAGLARSSEVIVKIEPWIGLATLRGSMQQVMGERMHARRADVRITLQIECCIEEFPAQEDAPDGSFEPPHSCHYRVITADV